VTKPAALSARYRMWLLLLIILLGTALRFYHLGAQSLWYDEAFSLAIADRLKPEEILTNQGHSTHPPLYYLLLHTWIKMIGVNDFTTRVPSLLAGVLTIPLIYVSGRKLFDLPTGLWSALFIAVFPFHVYYAQEARMYTLVALFTTLSLWLFLQAIERNHWLAWGGYWLCLVLGIYTHYFIGFVILVYHLYLVLNWQRYRHLWLPVIITDGLLILAFLPQTVIFIREFRVVLGPSYWLGRPNPLAFFTTIYFFIVSYTLAPWLHAIGLFVVVGILAIGLYEQLLKVKLALHFQERALLSLGAFLPILIVLAISQIKPIFLERTLIICTPFLILLLAEGLRASRWRSPMPYLFIALGLFVVISSYRFYFDATTHKPPLREAAQQIAATFVPGDVVLHTGVGSFLPFLFYRPPPAHYLLWGDPDPRLAAATYELFGGKIATYETIAGYQRVWLVVMLDHSVEYQRNQVRWFDDRFPLLEASHVGGILIRLYDCTEKSAVGEEVILSRGK
jgi:mannosyltransferase